MLDYVEQKNDKLCCGCKACEQVCPRNVISFKENREGFFYPDVDFKRCIQCGLCEKVCPIMNRPKGQKFSDVYAVQIKDKKILKNSSSGGVFRLLADAVIENGGYVVGCVWSKDYHPILSIANCKEELIPMQGSKYLSSDTSEIYKKVKILLEKKELVLFTGTPCQCGGLINYLQKNYDNLITADFLCHGVPSQKAFDAYIEFLSLKLKNKGWLDYNFKYQFRDKNKIGWGIVSSYAWNGSKKERKKYYVGRIDSYDYAFTQGYLNRYSCYNCVFRGENRFTDFTFSDFWGYDDFYDDMEASAGVSALSVNTDKGKIFFGNIKDNANIFSANPEYIATENPSLLHSVNEKIPIIREDIYNTLERDGWKKTAQNYFRCNNWYARTIWYMLPRMATQFLRKIVSNLRKG